MPEISGGSGLRGVSLSLSDPLTVPRSSPSASDRRPWQTKRVPFSTLWIARIFRIAANQFRCRRCRKKASRFLARFSSSILSPSRDDCFSSRCPPSPSPVPLVLSRRRRGCNRGVSFKDPSLVSIDEEFRSRDRERLAAEGKRPEERRREGEKGRGSPRPS